MQRVFTAKVHILTWILLLIIVGLTFWGGWAGEGLTLGFSLILASVMIERIIHSRYVIDSNNGLTIHQGKFSRTQTIPLEQILRVDIIRWPSIGKFVLRRYLLLVLHNGREVPVSPTREDEFVDCIMRMRKKASRQEPEKGLASRRPIGGNDPFMAQEFEDEEDD